MARLDSSSLKKVTVYVGEKNYYERQQLRDMFLAQGIKAVVCHATVEALKAMLLENPPDMLVLSDDFDPAVFDLVKEIRHHKVGDNPFMLITMMVEASRRRALTAAIKAGVDDIVIKPLSAERVRERLNLITFHRPAFVATASYVGPERRNDPQPAEVKRIPVLNTLLEKVNGRDFNKDSLKEAIEKSMEQVLQAQLDSQSSQLGELCARLVHAYDSKSVSTNVQDDLLMLSNVLLEASEVAARLRDAQLVALCKSLSDSIVKLADHYDEPSTKELDLLRKITAAFQMAMDAKNRPPGEIAIPGEGGDEAPSQLPLDEDDGLDLSLYARASS
jgi:response regulator RpfG family c-di-GMP phosphodiesterase